MSWLLFLSNQVITSYQRLPERLMYWEQQLGSGNALVVIKQVILRDRFRVTSRHLACSRQADAEESFRHLGEQIVKIRPLVDVLNRGFQPFRKPPRVQSIVISYNVSCNKATT
jgi:hypothetical protein